MKTIILAGFFSVSLLSCSSPECKYLKSMGKKAYDKNNANIKALNIKISQCPTQGNHPILSTLDPACKEKHLKEFAEQHNCNK